MRTSIMATSSVAMLLESPRDVNRNASVKTFVAALEDIEEIHPPYCTPAQKPPNIFITCSTSFTVVPLPKLNRTLDFARPGATASIT